MISLSKIVALFATGHFYIDFLSSFVLSLIVFGNSGNLEQIYILILLYNILAFGLQPFFGLFVDYYKRARLVANIGLSVSTLGLFFFFEPLIASILLGFGNAMYHVGGGVITLNLEPAKATYPGVYVAPGALGLFLGGALGYCQIAPFIFIIMGILISGGLIIAISKISLPPISKFEEKEPRLIGIVLLLLLISVCMRALIGFSLNLDWKTLFVFGLALTTFIAAGKFFGGFLADKYGFLNVGITGLLIAAPLLTFFQDVPVLIFIGAFGFNIVMPITLTALTEMLPNYKGFVFGLTTLSLVFGYLLFLVFKNYFEIGKLFTAVVIMINLGTLYFGLKKNDDSQFSSIESEQEKVRE